MARVALENIHSYASFPSGVAWVSYNTPHRSLRRIHYFAYGYGTKDWHKIIRADTGAVISFKQASDKWLAPAALESAVQS